MVSATGGGSHHPYMLGTVRVRLVGTGKTNEDGSVVPSVTAPTVVEATSALERAARVIGADGVLKASADYRRAAIAAGLNVRIEVQAWGTAFKNPEAEKLQEGAPERVASRGALV